KVKAFCGQYDIEIPDISCRYKARHSSKQRDHITIEHHCHFDIFNAAINFQLMELNCSFSDSTIELLTLSSALDPTNSFKSFDADAICKLASKFYPEDFTQ